MKNILLDEIIIKTANAAIKLAEQNKGIFPAGSNGPHGHKETPLRNSSHWLITILKAYEITNDSKYLKVANKTINYLLSEAARPNGFTFIHRKTKGLDQCNGLVGQAWTIEALVESYRILGNEYCIDLAEEVFLMHPFNTDVGIWKRLDINGSSWRGFDLTLNHQIWFAAAGSLIVGQKSNLEISNQIRVFLEQLPKNISMNSEGRFRLPINWKNLIRNRYLVDSVRVTEFYKFLRAKGNFSKMKVGNEVEDGYHPFHLYGLGLIKEIFPDHKFWSSSQIKQNVEYLLTDKFYRSVMTSKYGIGYNPPGIEVAYSLQKFGDLINRKVDIEKLKKEWLYKQMEKTYDFNSNLMSNVEFDKNTYAARIYEATRLIL